MLRQKSFGKVFPPSIPKSKSTDSAPPRPKVSMAVSMRDLDVAFQGAGQKSGLEIWRIENFRPVPIPKASYGKFFMGDAYVILKTTALKSGALRHDIHYWLGKDTSQDEAGTAAVKTVELDASLGGRAVQYREVQGHESEKFLSYFKPCIIPQEGGAASGFKLTEVNKREEESRLYICRGKHTVHVKEVPFARSSLTHDDIFILDTKSKIFQFNGSNSSIQERAKALEVVQYLKDTYHDGKCDIATVEDGKMMADAETGEFWGFFGGFAPLPKKTFSEDDSTNDDLPVKLLCIEKGKRVQVDADSLTKELLATTNCYVLDCGVEVFVWMGRSTTLEERKAACVAADELLFSGPTRKNAIIIRVIEGYETVAFRSKFSVWPQLDDVTAPEDGKFKIAALLKLQGVNVKGLEKAAHLREEPQPYIDCTGNLQVWRVNGQEKSLIPSQDQSKFYSGDCYIFQYNYHGEDKEEVLVGTWFGKKSIEQERSAALSMAANMVESLKFQSVQARVYEGKEPIQFFAIFQSFVVFKGGVSSGFKKHIAENGIDDETYSQDGTALFRIEGSGPDNMQSIQVDLAASSLNSSYCYILHSGNTVFTWSGNLTSSEDQELVERQLDIIKPNLQSKPQKEGYESDQFWNLLKGKSDYGSKRIKKDAESELHLLSCTFTREGDLKVTEIFNFTQDDLMTEDIFILDCKSTIFVWVGQEVNPKNRTQALSIGEKFLEKDFLMEKLSRETPIFIITEENEPSFFTRFFTWDSAKSSMHGNSFQRKLAMVKNGVAATLDKPKRRVPLSYGGRSAAPTDKPPQRSRSVSFSPERVRVRGRSPAFNALAAAFENPNRNLSTPPPVAKKLYPKSFTPDSVSVAPPKSSAIAALTSSFEKTKENPTPRQPKVNSPANNPQPATVVKENNTPTSTKTESPTTKEDVKDGEAEEDKGLTIFPYERLTVDSTDPAPDIDVTKRETYLSSVDFKEKFAMKKDAFFKLPKWKQNKLKVALKLF